MYIDRYPNSIADWRLNHLQKSESHWVWSPHVEPRHVQVARGEHEAPGGKPSEESMINNGLVWLGKSTENMIFVEFDHQIKENPVKYVFNQSNDPSLRAKVSI